MTRIAPRHLLVARQWTFRAVAQGRRALRRRRLFATQGCWMDLATSNPPRELMDVLLDLDGGSLQAHQRGKHILVHEAKPDSRWIIEGLQRGRLRHQRGPWRRCRILEHLVEVLNFDATTTTPPQNPIQITEVQP